MEETKDETARMQELVDRLNEYAYHYYVLDEPLISDKEYDALYDELVRLEASTGQVRPDSPTRRVGGDPLPSFRPHRHLARLWSLDKAQDTAGLLAWETRVQKLVGDYNRANPGDPLPEPEYTLEYKYDGLTINLTYEGGQLVQAATRGNGEVGEAILPQVQTIRSVPLAISFPGKLEVQGEGMLRLSVLEEYNRRAEDPLKNARNAAAGALRNLNPRVTAERHLDAVFYGIGYTGDRIFSSQKGIYDFLKFHRFPVGEYFQVFQRMEDLIGEIEKAAEVIGRADYLIDGMVIKVNDLRTRAVLGYTDKFPRWALAYKFEAREVTTELREVVWEVGRTGKLTPSARLEPVDIGGVTVQRATLNNWGDIQRKKVVLGCRVWLRRSNDVIPEILGMAGEDCQGQPVAKPERCPACQSELVETGAHLFCPNSLSCKPQLVSRLAHFASRDAMDIETFSKKTAEQLYEALDLKDIAGLYELKHEDLVELDRFGDKKAGNLIEAIEKSKERPLASFIYALGIPNTGRKTARDLAERFGSLAALRQATYDDLITIPDVGDIVAQSILSFFGSPRIQESVDRLLANGVRPQAEKPVAAVPSPFLGKTVVLTGALSGYTRSEAAAIIERLGGKTGDSVSKKTDFVLVGENPGSKYEKAKSLGIRILTEDEFRELAGGL